jgi:ATP-dependent Clp protease, protease subunit
VKELKTERWIRLQGVVLDKNAQALMKVMDECLAEGIDHVHLMISLTGGNVFYGASLFSQIHRVPLEISTYNISTVQSIAVTLFCAGHHRYCVPEATFMIHPVILPPPQNQGFSAQQFREFSEACTAHTRSIATIIANATGKDPERVYQDMNQTTWFNAEQSKTYGLVNAVTTNLLPAGAEVTAIHEDGTVCISPPRKSPDLASLFPGLNLPAMPKTGIN